MGTWFLMHLWTFVQDFPKQSQKCEQFSYGPFLLIFLGFWVLDSPLIIKEFAEKEVRPTRRFGPKGWTLKRLTFEKIGISKNWNSMCLFFFFEIELENKFGIFKFESDESLLELLAFGMMTSWYFDVWKLNSGNLKKYIFSKLKIWQLKLSFLLSVLFN